MELRKLEVEKLEESIERMGSLNVVNEVVLFTDYMVAKKKNGDDYIRGTITDGKKNMNIIIWSEGLINTLKENNLRNSIVIISGNATSYNSGSNSVSQIVLEGVEQYTGDALNLFDFIEKKLDVDKLYMEFATILDRNLSEKAIKVYNLIMTEERIQRFKEEFAGVAMHDAQYGGLLNHTLKMLKIGELVINNDPRIEELIQDGKDILLLGLALHDIAKIYEYKFGAYQKDAYLTHRIIGIEVLAEHKKEIIELTDENFYVQLVAIINGHHDEFGEKAATVLTKIVFLIDMLDSQTTGMLDRIEKEDYTKGENDVLTVFNNGEKQRLTIQ